VGEKGALFQGTNVAMYAQALPQVQLHKRFALFSEESNIALATRALRAKQKRRREFTKRMYKTMQKSSNRMNNSKILCARTACITVEILRLL